MGRPARSPGFCLVVALASLWTNPNRSSHQVDPLGRSGLITMCLFNKLDICIWWWNTMCDKRWWLTQFVHLETLHNCLHVLEEYPNERVIKGSKPVKFTLKTWERVLDTIFSNQTMKYFLPPEEIKKNFLVFLSPSMFFFRIMKSNSHGSIQEVTK